MPWQLGAMSLAHTAFLSPLPVRDGSTVHINYRAQFVAKAATASTPAGSGQRSGGKKAHMSTVERWSGVRLAEWMWEGVMGCLRIGSAWCSMVQPHEEVPRDAHTQISESHCRRQPEA